MESALGRPIPDEARTDLEDCCNRYLVGRKLELEAIRLRDIKGQLEKFATASTIGISDEDVLRRIYGRLADVMIEVDLDPHAGKDGNWHELERPHTARLTRRVAAEVIVHLGAAVEQAIQDLDREFVAPGLGVFRSGRSFGLFLRELVAVAKRNDLPATVNNRDGVTHFSRFAFELNRRLPPEMRDSVASAQALQARVNRLISEGRRAP